VEHAATVGEDYCRALSDCRINLRQSRRPLASEYMPLTSGERNTAFLTVRAPDYRPVSVEMRGVAIAVFKTRSSCRDQPLGTQPVEQIKK
jgi:hypothetical protein